MEDGKGGAWGTAEEDRQRKKITPSQLCKRIKLADTATDPTAKVRGSKLVDTATNTPSQLCTRIKLVGTATDLIANVRGSS